MPIADSNSSSNNSSLHGSSAARITAVDEAEPVINLPVDITSVPDQLTDATASDQSVSNTDTIVIVDPISDMATSLPLSSSAPVDSAVTLTAATDAAAATAAAPVRNSDDVVPIEESSANDDPITGDSSDQDISVLEDGEYDELLEEGRKTNVPTKYIPYSVGHDVNPLGTGAQGSMHQTDTADAKGYAKTSAKKQSSRRQKPSKQYKPRYNEFIVKNTRLVAAEDTGDEDIPFSALREMYKYKAHVTNLSPSVAIDTISSHISSKLGVKANIRIVSRLGARALSLFVMFSSDSDTLDLRMAGLWPRGTLVSKWNPTNNKKSQLVQGRGHSSHSSMPHRELHERDGFMYKRKDQQQLNGQWRNK